MFGQEELLVGAHRRGGEERQQGHAQDGGQAGGEGAQGAGDHQGIGCATGEVGEERRKRGQQVGAARPGRGAGLETGRSAPRRAQGADR